MADSTLLLPNYNNEHVLPHTFAYLRKNLDCSKLEFVVVDDGSEDGGLAVLKEEAAKGGFARFEIIERTHEGIVHALNTGLEAVRTPYVFRIDGDAIVDRPKWVDHMKRYLQVPEIGLVGGHTIFDSDLVHGFGRSVISEAGLHDIGTMPIEPIGQRTLDSNVWRPYREFPGGAPYEVDTVLATCIGFRLEDARAVGGFDLRFNPVWIEDDDFGLSLRKLGRKVIVDPSVKIQHKVSLRGSRKPGAIKGGDAGGQPQPSSWNLRYRRGLHHLRMFRRLFQHARKPMPADFSAVRGRFFFGQEPWKVEVLQGHYQRWNEKWGFDPLNPDMEAVLNRYHDTELCWRYDRARLSAGRALLRRIAGQ